MMQVSFEPREVVVRQGDVSDCMYVLKSGQVRGSDRWEPPKDVCRCGVRLMLYLL